MENLKRIAEAMGLELRKGGQGYVIYNRHYVQIDNVPTLEDISFRLAKYISHRETARKEYANIIQQKESA